MQPAASKPSPAQWQPGDKVIITPAVSDDDANERFGGFNQPKPYQRYTDQPKG
ncbi:hypothetical protein [Cycloclasticus pugetii]|uniref:hypothetical protein n=1 Tax=Cycloclasticus pugetii TaxID=34068 RepID=UPI000C90EDDE|nr:hypothetical protein [Porticoccaceae bacterium]